MKQFPTLLVGTIETSLLYKNLLGISMIDLYTAATPNGHKISIALEELGIDYQIKHLNLTELEQKKPEFLVINPNGRIPAIVDHSNLDENKKPITIFESGAILLYLAEKTEKLIPQNTADKYDVIQWLMFQMGGIGPMQGQAHVFFRYMEEQIPTAIARYQTETKRLYSVLDKQLATNTYIAGEELSIADIANWPWVRIHEWAGVEISDLLHLQRWLEMLAQRPAFEKGVNNPPSVQPSDQKITGIRGILNK